MDSLDMLNFVQTYYERTWSDLVRLLVGAFVALGIIMPLFMQWLLSRDNEKQMRELIKSHEKDFDSKIISLNEKHDANEKKFHALQGNIFITQGNIFMKSNEDNVELKRLYAFLCAACCYLKADQNEILQDVVTTLITIMNSQNFPKEIPISGVSSYGVREIYDQALSLFEKNNDDGKYSTIIRFLKEKISFV